MKALKRTLTLLLTAAVMTAAIPYAVSATEETATVSDGTTDSAEQIGISTAEEFLAMESGKSYYLKNDIDFAGKTYVTLVATFNGVLDGRGHALKNFTLANESATADGHMGVFGKVCDGGYTAVKNLVIGSADAPISMTNHANADGYHGFLAGQVASDAYIGQIENVTVYGNYTNTVSRKYFAGGIFGYAKKFVMTGCKVYGSFTDAVVTTDVEKDVGGLVGLVNTNNNRQNVMETCTNNAAVSVVGTGSVRLGGLVGFSGSPLKVENCTNTANISGATAYVGGFVGDRFQSDLYVKNSNFSGTATGNGNGVLLGGSEGCSNRYLYITGCGEEDSAVTEVTTLEELQGMTAAGGVYKLMNDLDLGGKSFDNFVFSNANGFNGVFDGNGHSIYNFTVNGKADSDAGFFRTVSKTNDSLILNLTIGSAQNPYVLNTGAAGGKTVGAFAAYCSNTYSTLIDGVHLYTNLTHTGAQVNMGGFFGLSRRCSYLNSTLAGKIAVDATALTNAQYVNFGGFSGKLEADQTLYLNCTNYAEITAVTSVGKELRAAGFVGYATKNADFINCANFGNVSVTGGAAPTAAGFWSRSDGNSTELVFNCTNFGNISSSKYASGFFAWAKNPLALIDVVNFGTISGADATKDAFYNYSGDLKIKINGVDVTQTELPVTKLACTTAASDLNFTMQTGASVRLETPAGLRFRATVNTDGLYWERMSMYTEVGYGMLISPAVFVSGAGAFTREALDAYAKTLGYTGDQSAYVAIDNTNKWFTGTEGCIAGTLANIQTNHYDAKFSGLAYLDLTVNGQTVRTLYAGAEQSRSVKEVATSALNDLLYKAADGKLYRADGNEYTEADAADYTNVVESGKTLTGIDGTLDLVSPYTEAERTVLSGFAN